MESVSPCSVGASLVLWVVGLAAGVTLVHFSDQLKRILWDRGAIRGCLGGVYEVARGIKEYQGVFRVYDVSETAQVELRSGRV